MQKHPLALALAMAFPLAALAQSQDAQAPVKSLGVVTVTSGQPTSLPTQIPTTMEGVNARQIEETINATDSEDALKYLPSLLVRKRYEGDYNHAVLSSRASGTGNSARSAVYADGILLSNYLGNGATYAPRWGLVTPEEIERVDVMYGPFSAAYPGNSAGAIVDYVTRMPTKFEAHVKVGAFNQHFQLYNTDSHFGGQQASFSLGNREGAWSWFVNFNHLDSAGQPLGYVLKTTAPTLTPGTPSSPTPTSAAGSLSPIGVSGNGTLVTGGVYVKDNKNYDALVIGTTTQYRTVQDHAKVKVAYDFSSTIRASYTLGYWENGTDNTPVSYLKTAAGAPFYSGTANDGTNKFSVGSGDFSSSRDQLIHVMHGLSVKSNTQGVLDWEAASSWYNYQQDDSRKSGANTASARNTDAAGTLTDQNGTGWNNQSLKGTWRPMGKKGEHIVDFGYQHDSYKLNILSKNLPNWNSGAPTVTTASVGGHTESNSVYAQDTWAFAPDWKTVLGARVEDWTASGRTLSFGSNGSTPSAANQALIGPRNEQHVSPKAALSYQVNAETVIKAATGKAVRMPTVQELYGSTSTVGSSFVNDPTLRPERSWTTELSAERDLGNASLRVTAFTEDVRDSLYSQTVYDGTQNITRVSNIDRVGTKGVEIYFLGNDVIQTGLDLSSSLTYADSRIKANSGYVVTPGDTIGKYQPRVPVWRATALANYHWNDKLSTSLGARYSGKQYSSLNNADINGFAYTAASKYFTVDARLVYKASKQWTAAFGIDNLNNYTYWNFHPYPSRTYMAELKFDL